MINLDTTKFSCGCLIDNGYCNCEHLPFTITRVQLKRMSKWDLLTLYTRCINDEMSPTYWRGLTKARILEMFLERKHSVVLTPFI